MRRWMLVLLLAWPAASRAAWDQKYSQCGDDQGTATSVHSPDGQHVFVTGINFNVSNPFTDPIHRILVSQDGGESFLDITTQAQGLTGFMLTPTQIFFADADHGWLVIADKVARTTDGGSGWTEATLSGEVGEVHFADTARGLAVGEGGAIWKTADGGGTWSPVTNPATVFLRHLAFVDAQRGFACGFDQHEEGDQMVADAGQVLATTDGGDTWQLAWETNGEFLGRMFFSDGQAGWICAGNNGGETYLLRTQNGGSDWLRRDVPTTASGVFGNVTSLVRVHFHDGQRGRAVGFFDTGMSTSEGGNIYMIADYATGDGGTSWTLTVNSPGDFPNFTPEGGMADAHFHSDRLAWTAGTGLRIYKDAPPCASDDDCYPGFRCEAGACRPNTSGPCLSDADCYEGYVCRDGTCAEAAPGPCEEDDDCPGDKVCQHGHCVEPGGCDEDAPVGLQGCPFGQICLFGQCIQDMTCADDSDCGANKRCFEGRCYPEDLPEFRCLGDADCAASERCVETWCEPRGATDGGTGTDAGHGTDAGPGSDPGPAPDGTGRLDGADAGQPDSDEDTPETDGGNPDDGGGGCGCNPHGAGLPSVAGVLMLLALARRRMR